MECGVTAFRQLKYSLFRIVAVLKARCYRTAKSNLFFYRDK